MIEHQEELFNLRDWLEKALIDAGAENPITDKGAGCGGADLWIKLEGMEYFVHIEPVIK